MTPAQEKNAIDQDISNKAGQPKAISPAILGGRLKSMVDTLTGFAVGKTDKAQPNGIATLDENGKVPLEQLPEMSGGGETPPSANPNIHRFPKDASLTEAHIGLLAMQQINFLNFPPLSPEYLEIKAVLANTTPGTPEVLGEFEIELKGFFELDKTTITSNWDNNWQLRYVDYYSGSASISFEYLFKASKGNPYGTDDGSGFLGFADNTEKINALTWCLSNNNNYEQSITDKFDVVTPFYYDAISESFKIVLRQKEIPEDSITWQYNGSVPGTQANTTTTVQSAKGIFEQVKSTILGTIVGIDGSDVLIDTSPVQTLRMASTEDGAFGILPLPMLEDNEELGLYLLFPWRNGRVIDYNGLAMNHNINPFGIREGDIFYFLTNGIYYKPLTSAMPNEPVLAKN